MAAMLGIIVVLACLGGSVALVLMGVYIGLSK